MTDSDYYDIQSGQFTWSLSPTGATGTDKLSALENAAFFVVNSQKTGINEQYEGYYMAISDNSTVIADGYDAVSEIRTLGNTNNLIELSPDLLGFSLTGTDTSKPDNISEIVETSTNYDFTDPSFADSLIIYLFKLRTSMYASNANELFYVPVEKFAGSLRGNDQRVSPTTSQLQSFYLQNVVNANSNYMELYVNKNISQYATVKQLTNTSLTMNPVGSYTPCKGINSSLKWIGDVDTKLTRALQLVDNVQTMDLDIICDSGLSTIFAYTRMNRLKGNTVFDDTTSVATYMDDLVDPDMGMESNFAKDHKTLMDLMNNTCANVRKDCINISDPIRGVFVQGTTFKTLDRKDRNFTQHIYTPLLNMYSAENSNYTAAYANWINVFDDNVSDYVWVPFSGWQAAIMARMDARLQPWYAPFGLNNGIIQNIADIAVRPNQKQQDMLYRIGVNPIVYFQGDGFVVWGQKTLQAKPSVFDRINVRRLFLVLERATRKTARYFVGEPNTVFTRTRVVNTLKPIFELAKNNEGCYDYYIVCDERNNTPAIIQDNTLKIDIYIKPVITAEFILCTFYATPLDADFNEILQ